MAAEEVAAGSSPAAVHPSATDLIEDFVRGEYPKVVATVALASGNSDQAEDAVQDALIKVLADGHRPVRLGAWVTVVAVNRLRSLGRRSASEQRAITRAGGTHVDDPSQLVSDGVTLDTALSDLSDRQRQIVLMYYYLGYPVSHIAGALEVSQGTVKKQLHRARARLAELLGKEKE